MYRRGMMEENEINRSSLSQIETELQHFENFKMLFLKMHFLNLRPFLFHALNLCFLFEKF